MHQEFMQHNYNTPNPKKNHILDQIEGQQMSPNKKNSLNSKSGPKFTTSQLHHKHPTLVSSIFRKPHKIAPTQQRNQATKS